MSTWLLEPNVPFDVYCGQELRDFEDHPDVPSFVVLDPENLWVGVEPDCDDPIERRIDIGPARIGLSDRERSFAALIQVVRERLPGLRAGDRVAVPGYPDRDSWMVPVVSVIRDGRVAASVHSIGVREVIRACPGTGIAGV
ncbi:MAG: hypothetical protein WEA10_08480 [Actinomycetota bacterium]